MRRSLSSLSLVVGAVALLAPTVAVAAPGAASHERVIVVLHDHVDARGAARDAARQHRADVSHVYEHALRGFAARVPAGRVEALRRDARVAYVESDDIVRLAAQTVPTGIPRIFATSNANLDIDSTDDVRVDVDVAVLDTGIDLEHPDLNVVGGVNCLGSTSGGPPWSRNYVCASGGDDDHYHGTHVAGTVAAIDNGIGVVGVAAGARLHAVKVLDSTGSGYEGQIVAGIDWVAANAGTIEVANMSLGGSGHSQAEYDAIQGAVNAGVAFAVSAGNSDADANNYSPGGFDNVLSVSALADFDGKAGALGAPTCRTDQDDTLADFSNWGPEVDITAPGVCILSTYPIEQGSYGTISGTSMSSPHVAGALALLASKNNPGSASDVSTLYGTVVNAGNFNWHDDSGDGTEEPLLDVSSATTFAPTLVATGDTGGTTNTPPTAAFTSSCTDLSCSFDGSGSTDSGGTISSYSWDLGDGTTKTGATASHTYAAGGTYTVTLTVTDDGGATDTEAKQVSVTAPSSGGITLSAAGYKVKGVQHADLTWSGATSTSVDVYRNGTKVTTTANDGAHTDNIGQKGGGSHTYKVCEATTTTCSGDVTIVF